MKSFGDKLRDARKKKNIKVVDAAKYAGVSRNFLYDLENENKNASLETITKLADLYDCPELIKEYNEINSIPNVELEYNIAKFLSLIASGNWEIPDEPDEGKQKLMRYRNMIAHGMLQKILEENPKAINEIIEYLGKYENPNDDNE